MNGTNVAFTLTNTPDPASSLAIFRNGILQSLRSDYHDQRHRHHVRFGGDASGGDTLLASYRVGGASPLAY